MDRMINYIRMTWKLAWLLRTYRTCNLTVRFSRYELYNKLLDGVILFKVILGVTKPNPYIYIYKRIGQLLVYIVLAM